jgi:D-aminoacyl-tRNA deacylase
MRVVIQRVNHAAVKIDNEIFSRIGKGLVVFAGIEDSDSSEDISWITNKIVNLRIFDDVSKVPNLSCKEMDFELLLVSQFTLLASTRKGNRPSYIRASKGITAIPLYEQLITEMEKQLGKKIQTGVFGADMKVSLENDGPVTILMDSKNKE